jgi:hypothetical protein
MRIPVKWGGVGAIRAISGGQFSIDVAHQIEDRKQATEDAASGKSEKGSPEVKAQGTPFV